MGRSVTGRRYPGRHWRLTTLTFASIFLLVTTINSLGSTYAQAISLPVVSQVVGSLANNEPTPAPTTTTNGPEPVTRATSNTQAPDTTAPSVPGEPFAPAHLSHATSPVLFSWASSNDDSGRPLTYAFQISQTKELDENGTEVLVNPRQVGALSEPTYTSSLDEGVWHWQVRSRDESGNESPWSRISQVTVDNTAPVISHTISNDQIFTSTQTVSETINEINPLEYAIRIVNTDGSELLVDGQPVDAVQNPAMSNSFSFEWDTTTVPNNSYKIVLTARDRAGHVTIVEIPISVHNEMVIPAPPVDPFPPLTPDLTPVALNEAVVMTVAEAALSENSIEAETHAPTEATPEKDVLAQRIEKATDESQKQKIAPSVTCARFFGVCWYVSVPGTIILAAAAYLLHQLRQRSM